MSIPVPLDGLRAALDCVPLVPAPDARAR